ncbi:MAG TPA: Fic family protein [Allosphingosinicella sp.]|jgi:Fic family protein
MATSAFPSGHYLEFVSAEQVRPRFDRLVRRLNVTSPDIHPLLHAIAVYYETLLIHPLRDGNGRLARLLFQLSLRQTIGLRAPILPLGPASAASRPVLIAAYLAWEFDRDAQPLVDFVVAALAALAALYAKGGKRGGAAP